DESIDGNEEKISSLKAKVKDLNYTLALVRNSLIGVVLIAGIVLVVNKRFHFGEKMTKGFDSFRNGRKEYDILDFSENPSKGKPSKSKGRSALKNMFSFLFWN
ncbi:MAG: hypothetical protein V5A68_08020, partial [Candidatus Thermoplasmatota archaeon]